MKRFIIPCLSLVLLQAEQVIAESSLGLIGGNTSSGGPGYAAFVDGNGVLTPINLGFNGSIGISGLTTGAVSINNGLGLIGGQNGTAAYAAFLGPGNTVIPLTLGISNGYIYASSINGSNLGLITGLNSGSGAAYAAFVSPNGDVTPIPVGNGTMNASSINSSGIGLIGGTISSSAYAALVSLGDPLSPSKLSLGVTGGEILCTAINDSSIGLVGGQDGSGNTYAALVGPGSSVSPITLSLAGQINAVGINDSGIGLIGGQTTGAAYAALLLPGQLTPISLSVSAAAINSVDINSYGVGIIGGYINSTTGYAALIMPSGVVNVLNNNLPSGYIHNVAINDLGIGILGGQNGTAAYAALVAPGGQVTPLPLNIPVGSINSVIMDVLDEVTPNSIGSNWAVFNSQFAASFALNSHMTGKHRITIEEKNQHPDVAFLASADDNLPMNNGAVDKPSQSPSTIWFSPFGNYVHQKANSSNPSNNNAIGGFLLGYDYSYSDLMFGGALGYAYNYIGLGSGQGHGSVQEEVATFYGSYEQDYLMVNFALWGGYYQLYNKRNTLSFISSKGNTQGWIFSPHLEIAIPFGIGNNNSVSLEPFFMLDYVNNWQGGYTEKGASGLNLVMDSHYSSVLRSEAGLRLFEEWDLQSGKFIFGQKLSYVNQAPFHFGAVTTSFVASASSFPIAIGNSNVQNLGALEVNVSFLPWNEKYPYISLGLQAEAGSSYQSYFGGLEIGKSF